MLIHRYWQGPRLGDHDETARRLLQLHPAAELVDWTRGMLPGGARALVDATAALVLEADQARHVANVARLWVLRASGGHWLDHDVTLLGPLEGLPRPATAAHRGGHRCNCWLSFDAGDPFLTAALEAVAATAPGPPRPSTEVSGEALLERLWGDGVARVTVRLDVDGLESPGAPVVLAHAGRSANRRARRV